MLRVGIDEVGRGCWAGPLLAAAVILPSDFTTNNLTWHLTDSKLLSAGQRQSASQAIHDIALSIGIGSASVEEINALGLTKAVSLAMQRALEQMSVPYQEVLIDGSYNFLAHNTKVRTLVKADITVPSVSAASIVAKVARDEWMQHEAAKHFPMYGFERHMGYGTKFHREQLRKYGPFSLHRIHYKPIKALLLGK